MPQSERYYRAARFTNESSAETPYLQLQDLVFSVDSDLSVYRFRLGNVWHVAVVGDQPDESLGRQLQQILSPGKATELEPETLDLLFQRRAETMIPGGWIERHHRPGQRVVMTKFELGAVVMTRGVQATLEKHPEGKGFEELEHIVLSRHAQGDWCNDGDLDQHDIDANEQALRDGGRLFSVYYLSDGTERGTKIYVITEWDRSVTTALLPTEY